MGWILTLILTFFTVLFFNDVRHWRKGVDKRRKTLTQTIYLRPDAFQSFDGFRQTVIKKGILIALFMLVTPRSRKKRPLPIPEEPCFISNDELTLMKQTVMEDVEHPLHWPLIYAEAYRHADHTSEQIWNSFLQGIFIYTDHHNPAQALMPLQKALDSGFIPTYGILSDLYAEYGHIRQAITTILPASNANYAPAVHQHACYIYQETLGKMFQYKKITEYRRLFCKSARMGYPPSRIITEANDWE